jgi:3-keto-disaccharide hydrolase
MSRVEVSRRDIIVVSLLSVAGLVAVRGLAHAASEIAISFADMPVGVPPPGFTPGLTGGGGPIAWEVVEDATAPGGRALAQASSDRTDYRFPIILYDALSVRDVDVSVRFKALSGKVDRAAGIIVRAQDAQNYYVLRANALEDSVNLYKVEKGRRREIKAARAKVPSETWQSLRLTVQGARFEAYFNDQPVLAAEDKTFAEAGRVGLWTKADSITEFADLVIRPLGQ